MLALGRAGFLNALRSPVGSFTYSHASVSRAASTIVSLSGR